MHSVENVCCDGYNLQVRYSCRERKEEILSSAEKVLTVLVELARQSEAVSVKTLAQKIEQPLSSVYRYLSLLQSRGLVQEVGHTKSYCTGPVSLQLAQQFECHSLISQVALPELKRLAFRVGESVGLMAPVNNQAICVDMIESKHPLSCSYMKGRTQPLLRGAAAKAMLAYMGERAQLIVFKEFANEQDDWAQLQDELVVIRQKGYAVSQEEIDAGVWGVSAPLFSRHRRLEGGVSMMIPLDRAKNRKEQMIHEVVESARRITAALMDPF